MTYNLFRNYDSLWSFLLKGKNRMRFINKLLNNIQDVLSIYPAVKVTADRDRAHAYLQWDGL